MLDAVLLSLLAAGAAATPPAGPPVDVSRPPAHDVTMAVDVGPARDVLALLAARPEAPAALRRLRASRAFAVALSRDGRNPEDVLGRLVSVAAGTPDPLLSGYGKRAAVFSAILDAVEVDGTPGAMVEARRISALLPVSPRVTARLRIVPLFSLGGFDDVVAEEDGETTYLFVDLGRLAPAEGAEIVPREIVLSILRSAASASWKRLFAPFRVPPAWPPEKGPDFDAFLSRTVAEGPPTLFLVPDEFFPVGTMFDEPIARSFERWNATAEVLLDPKAKEESRREALAGAATGSEFWSRHASVVGVKIAETILGRAGTAKYVEALAAGPRAVAALYLEVTKKTKDPTFGKPVRKALEAKAPDARP
ncbi:MAG: hypothetical protein U0529_00370 [Thermoanaerobaculia bacterium]